MFGLDRKQTLGQAETQSYRRKDQVHVLDMISIGLIDREWLSKFSEPLRSRLETPLDAPNG